MSIRTKILLPMVSIAVACAMITGMIAIFVVIQFTSDFNEKQLLQAEALAIDIIKQRNDDARNISALVAGNNDLVKAITFYYSNKDHGQIVDSSVALMNATGVDFLTVLDTSGNVLARAHEPENFGDSLASQDNIKNAMAGKQYTTIEKGSSVKLSVRSGTPIYDFEDNMIGIVSLGYRFDKNNFVDYISTMTGAEVTVYLDDTVVSTTIKTAGGERAVGAKAHKNISDQVLSGKNYVGKFNDIGISLYSYFSPVTDVSGVILGMISVGLDTSEMDARITRDVWITFAFMVFLSILSGSISLFVSARIMRPIDEISHAAQKLAEGDVDVKLTIDIKQGSKDETVHLAEAFTNMISVNRERAQLISAIASGDLSGQIIPVSDNDVVGIALSELLDKNNAAFEEMNVTASQLDITSTKMAEEAKSLSQGAAQQAETVDRLNAKLEALSDKSINEAENAKQAADLSITVKTYAEKGSLQMDQMMDAVDQISKASKSIENVIKVIDDIAFQTNILALNAAVEAARAGQHGKGFAVVAEEVRSLASKSQNAAKDTGSLIANSIDKAVLGARIANDTAASFADIVGGINKSTVIVDEIAAFMQQQKAEIEGIVHGMDEIKTIVSSVTSSAEQSAMAGEEMRTQAVNMASTLSSYNLRDQQRRLSGR